MNLLSSTAGIFLINHQNIRSNIKRLYMCTSVHNLQTIGGVIHTFGTARKPSPPISYGSSKAQAFQVFNDIGSWYFEKV